MYGPPSVSAGGARLVAAMEHVDRVVNAFVEDIGRAVAQVRAEVAAERDVSLETIAREASQIDDVYRTLQADKADFETHRVAIETELERRWTELKNAQERDKEERAAVEREIREMSQRAAAETQAAALIQMQASQAAQAAALGLGPGGMMMPPGSSHGMATPAMPTGMMPGAMGTGMPGSMGMPPSMPGSMGMPPVHAGNRRAHARGCRRRCIQRIARAGPWPHARPAAHLRRRRFTTRQLTDVDRGGVRG